MLDTISRRLETDCCWVQLMAADGNLCLAASREFTPTMQAGMALVNLEHPFSREIIGTGNAITITDMNRNGHYDIPFFREAGFRSLVSVPIMTYRVRGIMGIGYRTKKRLKKDHAGLLAAIAGLTGMALGKCDLQRPDAPSRPARPGKAPETESRQPEVPPQPAPVSEKRAAYREHQRRMRAFRDAHPSPGNW